MNQPARSQARRTIFEVLAFILATLCATAVLVAAGLSEGGNGADLRVQAAPAAAHP